MKATVCLKVSKCQSAGKPVTNEKSALSQHCTSSFGINNLSTRCFYILPTDYTSHRSLENCEICCPYRTGKRVLSTVSAKRYHTSYNCFLFTPKAPPVMGAWIGALPPWRIKSSSTDMAIESVAARSCGSPEVQTQRNGPNPREKMSLGRERFIMR